MAIVTGRDLDQFALLEREVIEKACRPEIIGPDALLHRHDDVHRGLADRVMGAVERYFNTSSIALGAPHRAFTSHGASTGAQRDCLSSPLRV
jgi:hypothetical protein